MRRACGTAVVFAVAFALHSAAAGANTVTPSCTLPNLAPVSCGSWQASAVTLRWSWSPTGETGTTGCQTQTFSSDTPPDGRSITCTVNWGPDFAGKTATVFVDRTPPIATSAAPDRPPDHDGWYNHPVAFTFQGSDANSGIASCDTVTYAGPGGPGASVIGGCTDQAGNRGLLAVPLAYDATPPARAIVSEAPANGSIRLNWLAPPDAASIQVVRLGARQKTVYHGSGGHTVDRHLKNGVRYRYEVTVFDQAGNAATTRASGVPTAAALRPLSGTMLHSPPRLTWRSVRGADYYNVQLYRGNRKLLSAWPHGPHLKLRRAWTYNGKHRRLVPGVYRWYVWPGYGSRSAHSYGRRLGASSFRLRP